MTDFQWHFEYLAQIEREREHRKFVNELVTQSLFGLRELLIKIGGLNIANKPGDDKTIQVDGHDIKLSNFTPASMLWGNPELLDMAFKSVDTENKVQDAIDDPAFEAFSQALMNDEGDMDPIITGPQDREAIMRERWFSPYTQDMLKQLGVKKTGNEQQKVMMEPIAESKTPADIINRRKMKFKIMGERK